MKVGGGQNSWPFAINDSLEPLFGFDATALFSLHHYSCSVVVCTTCYITERQSQGIEEH